MRVAENLPDEVGIGPYGKGGIDIGFQRQVVRGGLRLAGRGHVGK